MNVSPALRRVMFWMLVPGIVLAASALAISTASWVVQLDRIPTDGGPDFSENWISLPVNTVVAFCFTASVAINALILLRRPSSLTRRLVSPLIAVLQLTLYSMITIWIVATLVTFAPSDYNDIGEPIFVLIGLVIAVVSIMVCGNGRSRSDEAFVPPLTRSPLSVRGAAIAISFCVVASVVAVLGGAQSNDSYTEQPVISEILRIANTVVGTPWWIPANVIDVAASRLSVRSEVTDALHIAPGALNVILVIVALVSTRFRTWLVNWFFRLGKSVTPRAQRDVDRELR